METSAFEAKCDNCEFHMVLMTEHVVQINSESHMMETGHTVQITEVV